MTTPKMRRQFASDNWAGICPEAWAALAEANAGHAPSYGADAWTAEAVRLLRAVFETDCEVHFVFNGTAANSLAVAAMCAPFESVLCHEHAHLATDECGAPGFFAHGTTLVRLPGAHGKIAPAEVGRATRNRRDVHAQKVRAVSITQSTELGAVYAPQEIAALGEAARALDLRLHIDGARFAGKISRHREPAAEGAARVVKAADVIALPAVQRNRRARERGERGFRIGAERGVGFAGEGVGGGAHGLGKRWRG